MEKVFVLQGINKITVEVRFNVSGWTKGKPSFGNLANKDETKTTLISFLEKICDIFGQDMCKAI